MQTQKTTRNTKARPHTMIDRSVEEEILLKRWAASDFEHDLDDLESADEGADAGLGIEFMGMRRNREYLDS